MSTTSQLSLTDLFLDQVDTIDRDGYPDFFSNGESWADLLLEDSWRETEKKIPSIWG